MLDQDFLNDFEEQRAINEIVELGLSGRKTPKTWHRTLVAAIAIVMIGIPTFGYTFPALAQQIVQNIPFIGGIFTRIESSIADYATIINETRTSDGVSFTLHEGFFNGREIMLTYFVESDYVINQNIEWYAYDFGQEIGVVVDGIEIPTGLFGSEKPYLYWIDDYSFFFILEIPIVQRASPRLYEALSQADQIEVFTNFSHFNAQFFNPDAVEWEEMWEVYTIAQGAWNFSVLIERSERTRIHVDQVVYQYDFDVDDFEAWFNSSSVWIPSVSITPTRVIIDYFNHVPVDTLIIEAGHSSIMIDDHWQGSTDIAIASIVTIGWHVVDDLGATLHQLEGGDVSDSDQNSWGHNTARGSVYFEVAHTDATQIIMTPIIYEWHANVTRDVETERIVVHKQEFLSRMELEPIVVDLP